MGNTAITLAAATDAVAMGTNAHGYGAQSIAMGSGATASGTNSISIGTGNTVSGNNSGAIGDPTTITGTGSYSLGNNNTIGGDNTFVLGSNVNAGTVNNGTVLGVNAKISEDDGVALGSESNANTASGIAGYDPKTGTASTDTTATWLSTRAAVAVGDASAGITRQITGVAAGTEDTDAVNVAQLTAAQTHYYSANDQGTPQGNYNNDGATAQGSVAAGIKAQATGNDAIALGTTFSGSNSAFNGTVASGVASVAIGRDAEATGNSSIAMGLTAKAYGTLGMAIGANSRAGAVGIFGAPDGTDANIAVGIQAYAAGGQSAAFGLVAEASGTNSTALGQSNKARGDDSTAVGSGNTVSGDRSTAVGVGNIVSGNGSGAFGDPNNISGNGSYAVGNDNTIGGDNTFVVGSNVDAGAVGNGTVLGFNAKISQDGGVALGSESNASTAAGVAGFDPTTGAASTNTSATWLSTRAAVAVGDASAGITRQITGVAAGSADTDAVNVAQLLQAQAEATTHYYSVNDNGVQGANYDNDGAQGVDSLAAGADASATGARGTAVGKSSLASQDTTSIGAEAGLGSNAANIANTNVGYRAGTGVVGSNNTAIGQNAGDNVIGNRNAALGQQAGSNVTGDRNLAFGTFAGYGVTGDFNIGIGDHAGEFATGSQSVSIGRSANTLASDDAVAIGTLARATLDQTIALGAGATASASIGDVALGAGSVTAATVNTPDVTINGDTYAFAGTNATSTVSIGDGGTDGINDVRTLTNVAAGRISATSTDAINGSQLYATNMAIENITNGGGIKYFHAKSTDPDSQANGANSVAVGPNAVSNGDKSVAIGDGAQANDANSVALGSGSVTAPAVGTTSGTIAGTVHNYAGGTPIGTVSVGGGDSNGDGIVDVRTLTNVAAGRVDVDSTDAVNGSQLYATNQEIGKLDSRVTNIDDRVSNLEDSQTKYYSVNSTGGGNELNDGATGTDAIASGKDAAASGTGSVAMGVGATSSNDNSVALGAGSQDKAYTQVSTGVIKGDTYNYAGTATGVVSVGATGAERQIVNVAPGEVSATSTDAINGSQLYATHQAINNLQSSGVKYDTNPDGTINYNSVTLNPGGNSTTVIHNVRAGVLDTDAVNVSQLNSSVNYAIDQSKQYTDMRFGDLQNDVWALDRGYRGATASALAAAGLPQPYLPGKTMLSLGLGGYQGEAGIAVGLSGTSENGRWVYKASASGNTTREWGFSVGAGLQW